MKPLILFVDDEQNILRALRRFTRPRRDIWDLHFVESGQQAIELMEKQPVDVVVSDMQMPEMTGADLLEYISKKCPDVIRVILSGESEREQTYRTVGRSHQFLAKPCEPNTLISTIEAPLSLRSKFGSHQKTMCASIYDQLKSPVAIFDDLRSALDQQEPSLEKLVKIIRQDPNLAVRILQLANSAYFGRPVKTCNIRKAVRAIGTENLRNLLALKRLGNQNPDTPKNPKPQTKSHNRCDLALEASRLATKMGAAPEVVEAVYTTGLLLKLGALPTAQTGEEARTDQVPSLMKAAYITTLLGLPKLLSDTFHSILDSKVNTNIPDISKFLCNRIVTETS